MEVILREMIATDALKVAALHVATFNETHTRNNDGPDFALRSRQWSALLENPPRGWFGVVIEAAQDELIGFATGRPHDGGVPGFEGELNKIYLLRRYHRKGLGRKLLCAIASRFLARGTRSMLLFGEARNPSNGFYERMGAERLLGANGEFHGGYGWRDLEQLESLCQSC